jgi:hypothetical protein
VTSQDLWKLQPLQIIQQYLHRVCVAPAGRVTNTSYSPKSTFISNSPHDL